LDRGFQVLLEAYPECRRVLDYEALDLRPFYPGAEIWTGDGFTRFADPYRRPADALATLRASIGSVSDKFLVTRLRSQVLDGPAERVLNGPDRTAQDDLDRMGFTSGMVDRFFRPFFGGVLLNRGLTDSSRIFRYIFRMFSEGNTSIPRLGMGEIPKQLASRLDDGALRLGCRARSVSPTGVVLEDGEELHARAVVVATEGPEARRLLPSLPDSGSKTATCLYFDAPEPPIRGPILVLNGGGKGPVNNLAVVSEVSRDYAPPGRHLVSVSCLGGSGSQADDSEWAGSATGRLEGGGSSTHSLEQARGSTEGPDETGVSTGGLDEARISTGGLENAVRRQLGEWFGSQVEDWRLLRVYEIAHAQPRQGPGALDPPERPVLLEEGIFVCGDHRETASLQGALHSGRRAALAVLEREAD
jgi:hypothetical protein